MNPSQLALVNGELPRVRRLAQRLARRHPAHAEKFEAAAVRALLDSARRFVPDTVGKDGRVVPFRWYVGRLVRLRLGRVLKRMRSEWPAGRRVSFEQLDELATDFHRADPTASLRFAELVATVAGKRRRDWVRMRFAEGLSFQQIADGSGVTPEAVRNGVASAIRQLKERLARQEAIV